MKYLFKIVCCLFCIAGHASKDTSKIFLTKEAFIGNHPDLVSNYRIKEKFWGGWSNFTFQAKGSIGCRLSKQELKTFSPGTIFGFQTNGIEYVYSDSIKAFVTLVAADKGLSVYVGEQESSAYRSIAVHYIFYYSTEIGERLKILNDENLIELSGNPSLQRLLSLLSKDIKKHHFDQYLHEKQFLQVKAMVNNYLSNYTAG